MPTSPHRPHRTAARTGALLAPVLLALSACGGGGGGSAPAGSGSSALASAVDLQFPATVQLWRATDVTPVATGTAGASPSCTLASGALPAGLAFVANSCRIAGTPTEAGVATFRYQLAASTLPAPVERSQTLVVLAPPVTYNFTGLLEGQPVRVAPVSDNCCAPWAPEPGESIAYAVAAGSLPPGLVLDPGTGVVHGILAGPATGDFVIGVEAQSAGRAFRATSVPLRVQTAPGLQFTYAAWQAATGVAFDSGAPQASWPAGIPQIAASFSDFRLAAGSAPLPAGLALDPATGAIRGTAVAPGAAIVTIEPLVTSQGESGRVRFTTTLAVL